MKRIYTLLMITIFPLAAIYAQPAYLNKRLAKKTTPKDKFSQTQWWLGFKTGVNLSEASPQQRYSGYSPTNYNASDIEKTYGQFSNLNGQAGLEITFYHRGFSFSFQPNYRRQSFDYTNGYEWVSATDPANNLSLSYEQNHALDYFDFPVIIKYDIIKNGALKPFVQAGFFYSHLTNAQKEVLISGEDTASGNSGFFENQSLIVGAKDLFVNSAIGWLAGAGLYYDFWNIRIVLDASYRQGINEINNKKNRYADNNLSGIGDAMDDILLTNISVNIGCLFPLRFISSQGHNAVR